MRIGILLAVALLVLPAAALLSGDAPVWPLVPADGGDAVPQAAPTTVVLGSFQCSRGDLEAVDTFVEEVHGPIADELVAEGLWIEWGYLTHQYGDDYNRVMMYRARDLETHLRASAAFSERLSTRAPGVSPMSRFCPGHRDNIYTQTLP